MVLNFAHETEFKKKKKQQLNTKRRKQRRRRRRRQKRRQPVRPSVRPFVRSSVHSRPFDIRFKHTHATRNYKLYCRDSESERESAMANTRVHQPHHM